MLLNKKATNKFNTTKRKNKITTLMSITVSFNQKKILRNEKTKERNVNFLQHEERKLTLKSA